jgi:hypothetical protein
MEQGLTALLVQWYGFTSFHDVGPAVHGDSYVVSLHGGYGAVSYPLLSLDKDLISLSVSDKNVLLTGLVVRAFLREIQCD